VTILVGAIGNAAIAASPPAVSSPGGRVASADSPIASAGQGVPARPWLDTGMTIDRRIAALLSQMTLDERIGQIRHIENESVDADAVPEFLLGTRQGIPLLHGVDMVHGAAHMTDTTIFPHNVEPFTRTTPYTWPRTAADAPRVGKTACEGAVYPYGYGLDATGKLLGLDPC